MRLKLVMLSNLRALLVNRAVYLGLLLAVLCAASSTRAHALQTRARHRAVATSAAHRHAASVRTRSSSRTTVRAHSSTAARRRSAGHQPAVVRARMPIRHYRWMTPRRTAVSMHRVGESASQGSDTPAAPNARHAGIPTPQTSVAEAEVSDPVDNNRSTPQEAANQIAAAEIPAAPHAALRGVTPDAFRSTRIVAMAPLRGSLESLIRQNEKTNADNLERIEDDADLHTRIANGQLVRVPESTGLAVNPGLPEDRRYCRPWTASFLTDLAQAHQNEFHRSFEVSSAVRTVAYQKRLMRTNGNAAPAEGDIASPHLTGATIDIAKKGLTRSEIYWMRNRLDALQNEGKIDVEEEFRQSCFHITVYKSYTGTGPAHKPAPQTVAPPSDGADSTDDPADLPAHPA